MSAPTPFEFVTLGKLGNELFGIDIALKHINRIEVQDRGLISKVRVFDTGTASRSSVLRSRDVARPELLFSNDIKFSHGSIAKHKIKSMLDANTISTSSQLLGQPGPSIAYTTLGGSFPSVALVKVGTTLLIERNSRTNKISATFPFGPVTQSFPLVDPRATATFPNDLQTPLRARDITAILGFKPVYLLLVLARVYRGYCKKVAVALLPEP